MSDHSAAAAAGAASGEARAVALVDQFDALLLDLDGVVYAGPAAIPHAVEVLGELRSHLKLAYVTNNASRTPEQVAEVLSDLGVAASPHDVVTSAQAAARVLAERIPSGAAVLVVGGQGLRQAVGDRGFTVVDSASADPAAVVQGFSPDVGWANLAQATYAIRAGADYVASNTDLTIPTADGIAPGNGLLVHAVRTASGVSPIVAGKPETPLMIESVERVAAERPLVVGDRLDTDIAGANRAGLPSLLVLTGVTGVAELLYAPREQRPTFLGLDMRALLRPPVELGRRATNEAGEGLEDPWLLRLADTARHMWEGKEASATEVARLVEELESQRPAIN